VCISIHSDTDYVRRKSGALASNIGFTKGGRMHMLSLAHSLKTIVT